MFGVTWFVACNIGGGVVGVIWAICRGCFTGSGSIREGSWVLTENKQPREMQQSRYSI